MKVISLYSLVPAEVLSKPRFALIDAFSSFAICVVASVVSHLPLDKYKYTTQILCGLEVRPIGWPVECCVCDRGNAFSFKKEKRLEARRFLRSAQ